MEGESKAEEGKRVAWCPFAVPDNRDAAIDGEPSSTSASTVRFRVLSTSKRGSCGRDSQNVRAKRGPTMGLRLSEGLGLTRRREECGPR
jgi:hypothetical protein